MVISRGLAAPQCSKEGISTVENMKGAHVSWEAGVSAAFSAGQCQPAAPAAHGGHTEVPPTQPWLPGHKLQVPFRDLGLDVAHKPPGLMSSQVGSSQLLFLQQLLSLSGKTSCLIYNSCYLMICLFLRDLKWSNPTSSQPRDLSVLPPPQ